MHFGIELVSVGGYNMAHDDWYELELTTVG